MDKQQQIDNALEYAGVNSLKELSVEHYNQAEDEILRVVCEVEWDVFMKVYESLPDKQKVALSPLVTLAQRAAVHWVFQENC